MNSLNESVSLNRFATFVLPGFVINFFILWILYLFNPNQITIIKDYEFIITFSFAVSSLFIGLFIDFVMTLIESKMYKIKNINIRLQTLQKYIHVLNDFDNFLFDNLKIHLYEVNKDQVFKEGLINGRKIDNFNITTFEKYMKYRITEKETSYKELDFLLNKYYMFRNLTLPCIIIPIFSLVVILFQPNTKMI